MAVRQISPEVARELAVAPLPHEAAAFMAALSSGEISQSMGFRTQYGGTEWEGSLDTFPDWPGVPLPGGLHTTATGAWQDTETTWNNDVVDNNPGITFHPQDQIRGNWWLAQRDYKVHSSGGDLLEALKADHLEQISAGLIKTWPGGAKAPGLADTYRALMMAPPPPDAPSVALFSGSPSMLVPLVGYGSDGTRARVPSGKLKVDNPAICSAVISDQFVKVTEKSTGTTQIHYLVVVDGVTLTADLTVIVMALVRIAFEPSPLIQGSGAG